MIDKLYLYFIKTKYLTTTPADVEKLKELNDKVNAVGANGGMLGDSIKDVIETKLLGGILNPDKRKADKFILSTKSIMDAFIESELSYESKMNRLAPGSGEVTTGTLEHLSKSVDAIRQDILKNMTPDGRKKANALGLV